MPAASPAHGLIAAAAALALTPLAHADDTLRVQTLEPVNIVGNSVNKLAPSAAPLDATQPTSVIDERFIRDALRFNANFDDIIKYAPSMTVTSPEGPGLGKNEGISLRGFQDGQFNITFDGIPFGDASDFHHTTSAYFSNHVLGQAQIDRGPGGGSSIGNATFGGTVGLRSRDPSSVEGATPYLTLGSWRTRAAGLALDHHVGETGVFAEVSKESSDTFLSNTRDDREHLFLKTVSPLGPETTLTFVSSVNRETQNTVQGATLAQIAQYGWRFGLGDDPTLQTFTGYNSASYRSSFNYLGLTTRVEGWTVDNKVYFNNFDHASNKTTDPTDTNVANNGVQFYDATGKKTTKAARDVPGKVADNGFHAVGDVLRLAHDLGPGSLQVGAWIEHNADSRWQTPVDFTTGQVTGTKYGFTDNYRLSDTTDTVQPYVQYDWKATSDLTVSPGLRYSLARRGIDATLNKSTPPAPLNTNASYDAWLPSISAHERISRQWSAYAQVAKGFLAPPINVIQLNGNRTLAPELTTNYQVGTAYASREFNIGADIYYIDFTNYIAQTIVGTASGNESVYVNAGGAVYKGVEIEGTYALTRHLSLYGNASLNEAMYKGTDVHVASTPQRTAAIGLIYGDKQGLFWSLMDKGVGSQYGVDNSTNASGATVFANDQRISGYSSADAALGYREERGPWGAKDFVVSMNINNLFNVKKLTAFAGAQSVSGTPLYFGLPGRGVFVDMSMKF
jgi:iron complex outermembrane receptor protein